MKIQFGKSAPGASDSMPSNASGGTFSAASAPAALVAAALLLSGCGGSNGSDSAPQGSAEPDQGSPEVTAPEPSTTPTPPPVVAGEAPGADVLLIVPAGIADLPIAEVASVKFKSLNTTPSTAATIRAAALVTTASDGSGSTLSESSIGQSANVTVSWDPPTQNADGSDISDLAGYRVYQGNQDQLAIVQELNETGSGERRLTQIANVTSANSCFAVTAVDTSANESSLGDVVCKDIVASTAPTNNLAPALSSVNQLSSTDGQAEIQLTWQSPTASNAAAGAVVEHYNLYHGSQSQLFKVAEVSDADSLDGNNRSHVLGGIGGAQACFALTASYTDGSETSLGEIVCVPLVHSSPPEPGDQLRPYNVTVEMTGASQAQVGWDRPNTVVSSADATGIDRYDLYQGSRSQVFKVGEIVETGDAGTRRTTSMDNVVDGSNCFALTATDQSLRQSALSTIVCAELAAAGSSPQPPTAGTLGVSSVTAQETSPGSVAISWDAPELVAAGQPISNLSGYNLYQGSNTQLFKVAELAHNADTTRQQVQRVGVEGGNACFAVTAYDNGGNEAPLSEITCADISGAASVSQFGIVPPTDLATSALGGSTTVVLTWLASGTAVSGTADQNVNRYNIYQGDHDRLFKVREVQEEHDSDPRSSTTFTGVAPDSACFAVTAQYQDLRESRLSDIVCRDD